MRVLACTPTFLLSLPWYHIQMLPLDNEADVVYKPIQM